MKITVLGLSVLLVSPAMAFPISYTIECTATGSLGGVPFSNTLVSMTLEGDTDAIVKQKQISSNPGTLTVDISGFDTATFTNATEITLNRTAGVTDVGFADVHRGAMLFEKKAAFAKYNLTKDIGPISGKASFNPGIVFPTDRGFFAINAVQGLASFTAIGDTP